MTMNIKTALLLLPLSLPGLAFATVGGPQNIEVLGYEVKEQNFISFVITLMVVDACLNCIIIILNLKHRIS